MGKAQFHTKKRLVMIWLVRDNSTGEQVFRTSFGMHEKDRAKHMSGVVKKKFGIDLTPSEQANRNPESDGFFDY